MTYDEIKQTVKEILSQKGISPDEFAQDIVRNGKNIGLQDRDIGIILAATDEDGALLGKYATPEIIKALQEYSDVSNEDVENKAPVQSAAPAEGEGGEGKKPATLTALEEPEAPEASKAPAPAAEKPEEDEDAQKEEVRKMYNN